MTGFPAWALDWLRCPHCAGALAGAPGGDVVAAVGTGGPHDTRGGDEELGADRDPSRPGGDGAGGTRPHPGHPAVVGCAAGHRFDVARQGYLPLLGARARTDTGDDARMVAARADFLAGGWYAPIADAVRGAVDAGVDIGSGAPVVEVGAGTGHYLAAARGGRPGLALDASRYALRRAARLPGVAAVLADAWSPLPVRGQVAGAVLSVFAPRDPAELVRIAAPGGRIVIVTPEVDHLAELRGPLPLLAVDPGKAERVVQAFASQPVTVLPPRAVSCLVELTRSAVADLVAMGPTARHLDASDLNEAVTGLREPVSVTLSVTVTTLRRDG